LNPIAYFSKGPTGRSPQFPAQEGVVKAIGILRAPLGLIEIVHLVLYSPSAAAPATGIVAILDQND
jgi:hypothetical protein